MPLHDDEMKKRREKREAQRKKQKAESRRLKLTLLLAALVLVLCGVGIFRLSQNAEKLPQDKPQQVEQVKPTEAPKPTAPVQQDPITKIRIKAAGTYH